MDQSLELVVLVIGILTMVIGVGGVTPWLPLPSVWSLGILCIGFVLAGIGVYTLIY